MAAAGELTEEALRTIRYDFSTAVLRLPRISTELQVREALEARPVDGPANASYVPSRPLLRCPRRPRIYDD